MSNFLVWIILNVIILSYFWSNDYGGENVPHFTLDFHFLLFSFNQTLLPLCAWTLYCYLSLSLALSLSHSSLWKMETHSYLVVLCRIRFQSFNVFIVVFLLVKSLIVGYYVSTYHTLINHRYVISFNWNVFRFNLANRIYNLYLISGNQWCWLVLFFSFYSSYLNR